MFSLKTLTMTALLIVSLVRGTAPAGPDMSEMTAFDCELENTVFQGGEKITYAMYYNLKPLWIKAGEVTFTMEDRGDRYYVEAVGRTASSFEWFYKVRDKYTCEIEKGTLRPIRSTRHIREGSYRKESTAEYDFDNNKVLAKSGKTTDSMKEIVQEMDECMHDILSIIYYARNLDYSSIEAGSMIPANIFMDDEKYNIGFKFEGKERKKIKKLGKIDALLLKPQLIAGYVFEDDTEMNIWASDDGNRVPLLIESPVTIGSVKAVLKEYENLRYPLVYD